MTERIRPCLPLAFFWPFQSELHCAILAKALLDLLLLPYRGFWRTLLIRTFIDTGKHWWWEWLGHEISWNLLFSTAAALAITIGWSGRLRHPLQENQTTSFLTVLCVNIYWPMTRRTIRWVWPFFLPDLKAYKAFLYKKKSQQNIISRIITSWVTWNSWSGISKSKSLSKEWSEECGSSPVKAEEAPAIKLRKIHQREKIFILMLTKWGCDRCGWFGGFLITHGMSEQF